MKYNYLVLSYSFLIVSVFLLQSTKGQVVPDDRKTDWNPGLNAVGGIPHRTTVYKTLKPSGKDDTPLIQAALDSCPDNQVVMLGIGTFNIMGEGLDIKRSNITLRGSGTKTRLVKPQGTSMAVINIGTRWVKFMDRVLLGSDAAKGAKEVTVANNPGYKVGDLVALNQRPDPNISNWGPNALEGDWSRCWFGDCDPAIDPTGRPLGQVMEIASIAGNKLTFTTPLHTGFLKTYAARVSRMGDGDNIVAPVKYAGVEDLYVAFGEGGDGGGNITLFGCAYCWVKNVESDKSEGNSIGMYSTFRCELRDSYVHSTVNPTPGGAGYGIGLNVYAADNLVENNISWNFNKVMVMRASGGGNVIGYNYMDDGWGSYYPTQPEMGLNACHYATSHFELFEGNEAFNFGSESYWGNSAYIAVFRNHMTGLRKGKGFANYTYMINEGAANQCALYYEDIQTRRAVQISAGSWYYTFIGNVLGFAGMSIIPKRTECIGQESLGFKYEIIVPGGVGDGDYVPMWRMDLNLDQLTGLESDNAKIDTKVTTTLIRDGNFDFASNTIKWDRTQQTIPNSLYLKSKPVFFGTAAWPWVTPEITSSPLSGVLPAKARFDSIPVVSTAVSRLSSGSTLSQNYPNPFSNFTSIRYEVKKAGYILLKIYDFSGKEITTLVSENQTEGTHTVQWNVTNFQGTKVKSGMYFYQLKDKYGILGTKKMMLIE